MLTNARLQLNSHEIEYKIAYDAEKLLYNVILFGTLAKGRAI